MGSPYLFFLLVFALSVPFAVLGAVTGRQLYPGVPISALGFVAPVTAASILAYRQRGAAGVAALLGQGIDLGESAPAPGTYPSSSRCRP